MSAYERFVRWLKFWERTDTSGDCWIMEGADWPQGTIGYRQFYSKGAHRASYEMFIGEIPEGQCVLHKCDVPSCVNPKHLFLGTRAENVYDMDAKGRRRSQSGDDHWKRRAMK
jgi:hypothetical protein